MPILVKCILLKLFAIRQDYILQDVILNVGLGKKYWNTIIPLLNTGSVDNVINLCKNAKNTAPAICVQSAPANMLPNDKVHLCK